MRAVPKLPVFLIRFFFLQVSVHLYLRPCPAVPPPVLGGTAARARGYRRPCSGVPRPVPGGTAAWGRRINFGGLGFVVRMK